MLAHTLYFLVSHRPCRRFETRPHGLAVDGVALALLVPLRRGHAYDQSLSRITWHAAGAALCRTRGPTTCCSIRELRVAVGMVTRV